VEKWVCRGKWKRPGAVGFIYILNKDLIFQSWYLRKTETFRASLWQRARECHVFVFQTYCIYHKKHLRAAQHSSGKGIPKSIAFSFLRRKNACLLYKSTSLEL
jgi:hypothetical protein